MIPEEKKSDKRRVVVIAVAHPLLEGLFLHGKRRDDQSWSAPGGHAEPGETDLEAARRELMEETGICATELEKLMEDSLPGDDPGSLVLFRAKMPDDYDERQGFRQDPDQEFSELRFLNPQQSGRWHVPDDRNILLKWLRQKRSEAEGEVSTTSDQAANFKKSAELDKGQAGDWRKEGYTLKVHEPREEWVTVVGSDGKKKKVQDNTYHLFS